MKFTTKIDPNSIKESVLSLFRRIGIDLIRISYLGRGEGSAVFRIDASDHIYCLKTALYPERTQKVLNEAKIRTEFIAKGLPFVPAPRYEDQEFFTNGAVLYDYIAGNQTTFDSRDQLHQMARNLAAIHKLDFQIIQNGTDQIYGFYRNLKNTIASLQSRYPHLMNPNIKDAFTKALEEFKLLIDNNLALFPIGLSGNLHGDLSNNFITDPHGKLWLIDWENSEYGDIVEEVCTFVFDNDITGDLRKYFFDEYQKYFHPVAELNLEAMGTFYIRVVPVFNICWGIDQLNTNLVYKMEPERKLRDLASSAQNWGSFFSESTTTLMIQGIARLTAYLEIITKKK